MAAPAGSAAVTVVEKSAAETAGDATAEIVVEPAAEPSAPPLPGGSLWPGVVAAVVVALAALIALFSDTVWSMVDKWLTQGDYGHGILIVPVSVFLIWRRRTILAAVAPRPELWGLVPLAAAAFLWLLGEIAGLMIVKQLAFVGMLWGVVLVAVGWPAVSRMIFPLFFLVFAVPFGDFLVAPLQDITAVISVRLLQLSGVPVYTDGLMIHIPTGAFIVAETCSGLRFLISTITIGFLGAILFYRSLWRRLLFVALAFSIPVVANGIRAYGIVMLAYLTDHKVAVGVDHLVYGWIFLSIVTLCLLGIGMTFREHFDEAELFRAPTASRRGSGSSIVGFAGAAGVAVMLAGAAPAYAAIGAHRGAQEAVPAFSTSHVDAGWRADDASTADWRPAFPGADAEWLRTFQGDAGRVDLFVAYYRYQRQGAEVIGNNSVVEGAWRRSGSGTGSAMVDGRSLKPRADVAHAGSQKRLIWQWYLIDGETTADPFYAKYLEIRGKLFRGHGRAAAFVLSSEFGEDERTAVRTMQRFLADAGPTGAFLKP
jgi:exosortase A